MQPRACRRRCRSHARARASVEERFRRGREAHGVQPARWRPGGELRPLRERGRCDVPAPLTGATMWTRYEFEAPVAVRVTDFQAPGGDATLAGRGRAW